MFCCHSLLLQYFFSCTVYTQKSLLFFFQLLNLCVRFTDQLLASLGTLRFPHHSSLFSDLLCSFDTIMRDGRMSFQTFADFASFRQQQWQNVSLILFPAPSDFTFPFRMEKGIESVIVAPLHATFRRLFYPALFGTACFYIHFLIKRAETQPVSTAGFTFNIHLFSDIYL